MKLVYADFFMAIFARLNHTISIDDYSDERKDRMQKMLIVLNNIMIYTDDVDQIVNKISHACKLQRKELLSLDYSSIVE